MAAARLVVMGLLAAVCGVGWRSALPAPSSRLQFAIGGFSIDTADRIADAAADGIEFNVTYNREPAPGDASYTAHEAHHMALVPGGLLDIVESYGACRQSGSCDEASLLAEARVYLERLKTNPLVVGYWVLDDWRYQSGSAQDFLVKLNALIHQITPGRPSICGFGGGVDAKSGTFDWEDGIAANFSPEGCDMVALYLYGEGRERADRYDWTMPAVLEAAFASLKRRGWEQSKTPLVGVPQAFGGELAGGRFWAAPTAESIATQAESFCSRGAVALIYYAWSEAATPSTLLPSNSAEITMGIRRGSARCKQVWGVE